MSSKRYPPTPASLYGRFKSLEEKALGKLFPDSDYRSWGQESLISNAEKLRQEVGRSAKWAGIAKDLREAVELRQTILQMYPFPNARVQKEHKNFVTTLKKIIQAIDSRPRAPPTVRPTESIIVTGAALWPTIGTTPNEDDEDDEDDKDDEDDEAEEIEETEKTEKTETTGPTLSDIEFHEFLDLIALYLGQIGDYWGSCDDSPAQLALTFIVSKCLLKEIEAHLQRAYLLQPEHLSRMCNPDEDLRIEHLTTARRAIMEVLQHVDSTEASLVQAFAEDDNKFPDNGEPTETAPFIQAWQKYASGDVIALSKALIYISLLFVCRKRWPKERLERCRNALVAKHTDVIHQFGRTRVLKEDKSLLEGLGYTKSLLRSARSIWHLGRCAVIVTGYAEVATKGALESLLLTSFAHLYARWEPHEDVGTEPSVSKLCIDFQRYLFWSTRPKSWQDIQISFNNWIAPQLGGAKSAVFDKLLESRFKEPPLILTIWDKEYSIDVGVRTRLGLEKSAAESIEVRKALISQLQREIDAFDNAARIFNVVHDIVLARAVKIPQTGKYTSPILDSRYIKMCTEVCVSAGNGQPPGHANIKEFVEAIRAQGGLPGSSNTSASPSNTKMDTTKSTAVKEASVSTSKPTDLTEQQGGKRKAGERQHTLSERSPRRRRVR